MFWHFGQMDHSLPLIDQINAAIETARTAMARAAPLENGTPEIFAHVAVARQALGEAHRLCSLGLPGDRMFVRDGPPSC
jgi:hypothetical protein